MDWKLFLTTFITLVVIMDPVGNVPVYMSLTLKEPPGRRRFALEAVSWAA
ncbi:MAG: MarC family protein [Thermoleophilia bacterium]